MKGRNSTHFRLLELAYGDAILAPGARTLGGFFTIAAPEQVSGIAWVSPAGGRVDIDLESPARHERRLIASGALRPNLCTSDPATWSAALLELASAEEAFEGSLCTQDEGRMIKVGTGRGLATLLRYSAAHSLAWVWSPPMSGPKGWRLKAEVMLTPSDVLVSTSESPPPRVDGLLYPIKERDPVLALLRARILLRETLES